MRNRAGKTTYLLTVAFFTVAILAWSFPIRSDDDLWAGYGAGPLLLAVLSTMLAVVTVLFGFVFRGRKSRFRLSAVLIGFLGVWIAVECVAYSLDWKRPNPFYIPRNSESTSPDVRVRYRRPPNIFWEGAGPGDLGSGGPFAQHVVFKTDSEGFRNHREVAQADIVFLGDSYTEAGNVNEEQTFAYQTGRLLDRTTANLGTAGYGPLEELAVLEAFAPQKRPKWVVWQLYEGNDLADVLNYVYWEQLGGREQTDLPDSEIWQRRYHRWRRSSPFVRLIQAVNPPQTQYPIAAEGRFRARDVGDVPMRFLVLPGRQTDPAFHPVRWNKMRDALIRGHELCQKQNIKLLVVLVPIKIRALRGSVTFRASSAQIPDLEAESKLSRRIQAVCRERQIPFLDPAVHFRSQAEIGEVVYFAFDSHLAPHGHKILAAAIAERIRQAEAGTSSDEKD